MIKIDAGLALQQEPEVARLRAENRLLAHECYRLKNRLRAIELLGHLEEHPDLIPPPPPPPDPWEGQRDGRVERREELDLPGEEGLR